MASFESKTYSKRLLHLISWSHWFTFFNILAAIALSSFYLFSETTPETIYGQAYLLTTWVSHMGFLTFMSFVLILFPLTILFPRTKFIRTAASVIFTLQLLLLLLDAFIYNKLGYHLNSSSSDQIITLISTQIEQNQRLFWFVSLILCLIILMFELIVSNYAWKHLKQLQKTIFARFVITGLVTAFIFSHITHIWADAHLDYDILRQDSVFPLSYPSTAKTLLTKYKMFNEEDYIKRKTSPLSFTQTIRQYPALDRLDNNEQNNQLCPSYTSQKQIQQSVFIILTNDQISPEQIEQFAQRSTSSSISLEHHIDTSLQQDAWFNLFYGLPNIYQQALLEQGSTPLLFQAIDKLKLAKTFTIIDSNEQTVQVEPLADEKVKKHQWFENLFSKKTSLTDISSLIFTEKSNLTNKFNNIDAGIHLIYFTQSNGYQFELFMDALLLAQKQKQLADIIWVSSIGNKTTQTSLSTKPALLIWPNKKAKVERKEMTLLTSQMDLQATLLKNWLSCNTGQNNSSNGSDLLTLNKNRVIANTVKDGIMVFNKDKSVFIDQNGNFESFSLQLNAPIVVNKDFPLMIDGVHFIKKYSEVAD